MNKLQFSINSMLKNKNKNKIFNSKKKRNEMKTRVSLGHTPYWI